MSGELLTRIVAFDLDAGASPGFFAGKLARANGWSGDYADRVVAEYRRYLYLTQVADHVVVPSDQVDMAWHQHLLDTGNYWDVFCPNVLGASLHHRPSTGDDDETHAHYYRRTLNTYTATFGAPPPADIWPPAALRFAEDKVAVSRKQSWVIPKRRAWLVVGGVVLAVLIAATVATFSSGVAVDGPVGQVGAGIVTLVLWFVALLVGVGRWERLTKRVAAASTVDDALEIDPYQAAGLSAESPGAVNVAVGMLVCDNAIGFDEAALAKKRGRKYRLAVVGPLPAGAHPFERAMYYEVAGTSGGLTLYEVHLRASSQLTAMAKSLKDGGLLLDHISLKQRLTVAPPMLVVVAVMVAITVLTRSVIGAIVVLFGLVLMVGVVLFARPQRVVTARGENALEHQRAEHYPVEKAGRENVRDGRELSWVLVLQGIQVLDGSSLQVLYDAITAPASKGGGARGSSSGGGGCGGGCGCGG